MTVHFVDSSKKDHRPPRDSLVVCAGTITCKTVGSMGAGFVVFKKTFSADNLWKPALQTHLNNYHDSTTVDMPSYIRIAQQDTYLGAVATVPVYNSRDGNCVRTKSKTKEEQYKDAIREAVKEALALNRPLYIQPLGIGACHWPPEVAGRLFADVFKELDADNNLPITIPIYNSKKGSNDSLFRKSLEKELQQRNETSSIVHSDKNKNRSANNWKKPLPSPVNEDLLNQVNAMSDHNAQVDTNLKIVSQNVQGPYAIKSATKNNSYVYAFDLPNSADRFSPEKLSALTGMEQVDCEQFINANNKGNEGIDEMRGILNKYAIGDRLGEGGFRQALETQAAYTNRMTRQIECLKNLVEGGANVLSIQEQPYLNIDKVRYPIFENIMNDAGYVSVANVDQRDVGIWVKKELKDKSFAVILKGLGEPLRGCAAQVDGVLCINIHVNRSRNKTIVDALINLKQEANEYASHTSPPLRISITGDMNLYALEDAEKTRLENNGFTTELVKGQEKFAKPSYEAFFKDNGIPAQAPRKSTGKKVNAKPSPNSSEQVKNLAQALPNGEFVTPFNNNRQEFINKIKSYQKGNKRQKPIYNTGQALLRNIDNITKNKPETLNKTKLEELNSILSAAKNRLNDPTNDKYKKDLAECSAKAYGKKSPTWRKLGLSLMLFGAAVLVLIGVLAAIPTTGASLASALGIVGFVAAGGAFSVGAGAFSFFHGREKGMSKTINQLDKALKDGATP